MALVACAVAPTLWFFVVASVPVGGSSVAGQVMIPFAADLAPEERRGRVVARIMTGLLLGILLARTMSGLVAQAAGWRAIYWLSAALMVFFAAVLWRALPAEAPVRTVATASWSARRSASWGTEPVLRRRAWYGACAFAAFSVLWTTLAFLLSGSPYRYSNPVIGLFGLVGAGGILAANLAGKLADSAPAQPHHLRRRPLPGRLVRFPLGRSHLPGRPCRRGDRPRHGDSGHADHEPGGDWRPPARRPQPCQ